MALEHASNVHARLRRARKRVHLLRRIAASLAPALVAVLSLGACGAGLLLLCALVDASSPIWVQPVVLAVLGLVLVGSLAGLQLERRVGVLDDECRRLETLAPSTDRGTPDDHASTDGWRLALAIAPLVFVGIALSLDGLAEDSAAHRWPFMEEVDDVTDLGLDVEDFDGGAWHVEPLLDATGRRALVNHAGDPQASSATAVASRVHMADAFVRTRCRASSDRSEQACGVVFRYVSADEHYVAYVDARTGALTLGLVQDGVEDELAVTKVPVSGASWHELEVVARGESVTLTHNGTTRLEAFGRSMAGSAGLWAPGAAAAYFDELTVEQLRDCANRPRCYPVTGHRSGEACDRASCG